MSEVNTNLSRNEKRPLPKLDQLYGNLELAGKHNELNRLLNCEPKKEWLKPHPTAKRKYFDQNGAESEGPALYIPISIIEYLLTSIYIKWRVEVRNTKIIANSIVVEVRLHVLDPITGEWDWQDGIGATPIHTQKGAGPTEFDKILTDSVMKAAPAAESYAIKDAAEKLGKIFGKDINRRDWLSYTSLDQKLDLAKLQASPDQYQELYSLLFDANLDEDEKSILFDKLKGFVSIDEFYSMKKTLQDAFKSDYDRVRDGDSSKIGTNLKAIQEAVKRPNT